MPHFPLPNAIAIKFTGRDSARYLHSRLSNDVNGLVAGSGIMAACLNAQGKAEALFALGRIDQETFLLLCDGGQEEEVKSSLTRFAVADRIELECLTEYRLIHVTGTELLSRLGLNSEDTLLSHKSFENGFSQRRDRTLSPGFDLILPEDAAQRVLEHLASFGDSLLSEDQQVLQRLLSNSPMFSAEISPDRVFLEYGLKSAVSFNKGCYVGQEVLERADSRGKLPRVLCRVSVVGERSSPIELVDSNDPSKIIAKALSQAYDAEEDRTVCFILMQAKHLSSESFVDKQGSAITLLQ